MYDYNNVDDFENDVGEYFRLANLGKHNIQKDMLTKLYNQSNPKLSTAPSEYAVYAFYENGTDFKKVGKATEESRKMRHRMSYYGNFNFSFITEVNYNEVQVKFVEVPTSEHAWALERYCQGKAYARNENMPWESKI